MGILIDRLSQFRVTDAVEVAIIGYLFYRLLLLIRRTQAMRMVWGFLVLALLGPVAQLLGFRTLYWLLSNVYAYIVFAIIVLFQNEIRRVLTTLGRTAYFRSVAGRAQADPIDEVVTAATALASRRHGAIIVFEREMALRQYMDVGIRLDADVSFDLIVSIFNPHAPLHDGAAIIQRGRVAAAACFLPLTLNPRLSRELGSRHRAAIGITEETDAVTLVVSEETGKISVVSDGRITRDLDGVELTEKLRDLLDLSKPADEETEEEEEEAADSLSGAEAAEGVGK